MSSRHELSQSVRCGLYIVTGTSAREVDKFSRQSVGSTLLVVPARKMDLTPRGASCEGA